MTTSGHVIGVLLAALAATVAACGGNDSRSASENAVGGTPSAAPAVTSSYSTNFAGTETPISEGGVWKHVGLDWTAVTKANGLAHGTQTGSGGYNDSYAYLTGFPANHSATAVVYLNPNANSVNKEVELLLRWSDSARGATGYECNLQHRGQYALIVRWNGPYGNFTEIGRARSPPQLKTGDVIKATVVGNVITVYVNGTQIMQATDSTYTSGNPGMGFYIDAGASNSDFGFSSFSASGL